MQSKNTQERPTELGLETPLLNASVQNISIGLYKLRELKASVVDYRSAVYSMPKAHGSPQLTGRHAIPAILPVAGVRCGGGLFSYGASRKHAWRQAGV